MLKKWYKRSTNDALLSEWLSSKFWRGVVEVSVVLELAIISRSSRSTVTLVLCVFSFSFDFKSIASWSRYTSSSSISLSAKTAEMCDWDFLLSAKCFSYNSNSVISISSPLIENGREKSSVEDWLELNFVFAFFSFWFCICRTQNIWFKVFDGFFLLIIEWVTGRKRSHKYLLYWAK